ncbi:lytic transglycosylase domain-containing protein [Polaromonas sp.]|uniref:lytic transglycosylase domain-containing protein n=1 Tax=Polaromonas sp. TaxID=1869339 RepID=UPI00286B0586|nr:lytic transglycosylase domain-containing protein [Polaromonas sp.]
MTAPGNTGLKPQLRAHLTNVRSSLANTADDIAQGFFEITHNSFALLGLVVVFGVITLTARPDLRQAGETKLITWLQERQQAVIGFVEPEFVEPDAIQRATASNPKDLPQQQAAVAYWLSKKYAVAPEPLSVLVSAAFEIGQKVRLDPTLILAVMAIESGFNPFAQSPVGAQGLMQVMTKIHHDKYENFGGKLAAFDPVTNLRVGVKVLQECIARAGSVEGGLKYYVGAANLNDDGGYASKVMAEHGRLLAVVGGKRAPSTSPFYASPAPARSIPASLPAKSTAQEPASQAPEKVALLDKS